MRTPLPTHRNLEGWYVFNHQKSIERKEAQWFGKGGVRRKYRFKIWHFRIYFFMSLFFRRK